MEVNYLYPNFKSSHISKTCEILFLNQACVVLVLSWRLAYFILLSSWIEWKTFQCNSLEYTCVSNNPSVQDHTWRPSRGSYSAPYWLKSLLWQASYRQTGITTNTSVYLETMQDLAKCASCLCVEKQEGFVVKLNLHRQKIWNHEGKVKQMCWLRFDKDFWLLTSGFVFQMLLPCSS